MLGCDGLKRPLERFFTQEPPMMLLLHVEVKLAPCQPHPSASPVPQPPCSASQNIAANPTSPASIVIICEDKH